MANDDDLEQLNFCLLHDRSILCQVLLAVWNPDKDLLALATSDRQLVVHRLNWQRLWAVSPEKKVTALCWRPDGKCLAVGHEDGSIVLHDVENGEVLRKMERHEVYITCLSWIEEDARHGPAGNVDFAYEDRTHRFYPNPPKVPRGAGVTAIFDTGVGRAGANGAAATGRAGGGTQRLTILCSGDREGNICLSAFGVFPISEMSLSKLVVNYGPGDVSTPGWQALRKLTFGDPRQRGSFTLAQPVALKLCLAPDLSYLNIICSATPNVQEAKRDKVPPSLVSVAIDTGLINQRRKEIRQLALQASCIMELMDVAQATILAMEKQWAEAMHAFRDKFLALKSILLNHGSTHHPREELLALLTCGSASPPLQQFLTSSLTEQGLKRLAKSIDTAGSALHNLIIDHLQPAMEIIVFRLGELHGLSRWRARMQQVGLHEDHMDEVIDYAGMTVIQVERMLRLTSSSTAQYRTFFIWLMKALKVANEDSRASIDQLPPFNIGAVASFLQTTFDKDAVGPQLAPLSAGLAVDVPLEEQQAMEDLATMGGFADKWFLSRTLRQQLYILHQRCEIMFSKPHDAISPRLRPKSVMPLSTFPHFDSPPTALPLSVMYYEGAAEAGGDGPSLTEYMCWEVVGRPGYPEGKNLLGLLRRSSAAALANAAADTNDRPQMLEGVALTIQEDFRLVDCAFYKDQQLALLLSERSGDAPRGWLLLIDCAELAWTTLDGSMRSAWGSLEGFVQQQCMQNPVQSIQLEDGRHRELTQRKIVAPLAISVTRGLACIVGGQRRILLYDLEDNDEGRGEEMT